jgi:hypothetical protein
MMRASVHELTEISNAAMAKQARRKKRFKAIRIDPFGATAGDLTARRFEIPRQCHSRKFQSSWHMRAMPAGFEAEEKKT